jgi:hypothetical protein
MAEPTTLLVGLDVHRESIAVAHASADLSSEIVYVGQIGRQAGPKTSATTQAGKATRIHRNRLG